MRFSFQLQVLSRNKEKQESLKNLLRESPDKNWLPKRLG